MVSSFHGSMTLHTRNNSIRKSGTLARFELIRGVSSSMLSTVPPDACSYSFRLSNSQLDVGVHRK